MHFRHFTLTALFALAKSLAAQSPPEFEAASVKLDTGPLVRGVSGASKGGPGTADPGRFTYTRQSLKFILTLAYDLAPDQLSAPSWMDDPQGSKFTITTTMPPETTKEQFHLMLQNLLTDRFHLTMHRETKEFPGYDMIVASGGPKFKEWAPDPNADPNADGQRGFGENGFPLLQPNKPGMVTAYQLGLGTTPYMIRVSARQSMTDFAKRVGRFVNDSNGLVAGAPQPRVTDKTGLSATYEFKLEFQGVSITPGAPALAPGADAPPVSDPGGPDLFGALEKQLGLKLVKVKNVRVETLVIDHADKVPTDN